MLPRTVVSNCLCCLSNEDKYKLQKSKLIDQDIAAAKRRLRQTQKIVLLGVGESGKSTFLKQMQIIHGNGFTNDENLTYRSLIYDNIIRAMIGLINGKRELRLNWTNSQSTEYLKEFIRIHDSLKTTTTTPINMQPQTFQLFTASINALWSDDCIIETYNRRREIPRYFVENLPYFMENFDRITQLDYIPTQADILRSRRSTTCISEIEIQIKNIPFLFIDVGGQRTQRQKWQQCFSDVTAILFLVSSSEYDEYLREDYQINRLDESCKVFETLINYRDLANVEVILFLNKYDLLKEKIHQCDISEYCRDFSGDPKSIHDVEYYLQNRFIKLKKADHHHPHHNSHHDAISNENNSMTSSPTTIYTHFTTAVDTNNIRTIFEMVKNMIFENNCRAIMLN